MNIRDWMACTDPESMLQFLGDRAGMPAFRRFAVECCRRLDDLIPKESTYRTEFDRLDCLTSGTFEDHTEIAEALDGALHASHFAAMARATEGEVAAACAVAAVYCALLDGGSLATVNHARSLLKGAPASRARYDEERRAQADLLRDLARPFK